MATVSTLDTWKVCQDSSNKNMEVFTRLKSRFFFPRNKKPDTEGKQENS